MSENQIKWCGCREHNHDDWQIVADHYCRHFIPNGWVLQYHDVDCHESDRILYLTGSCNICGGFMRSGTSVASNIRGAELFLYIYKEMVRFRPYDGYDQQSGHYNGAVSERSKWYRKQDDLSATELETQFVNLFREEHQETAREWFSSCRPSRPYCDPLRDRKSTLFQRVMDMARSDGCMAEMDGLLEYSAPPIEREDTFLTNYRFNVVPHFEFGSNEGSVLTLVLEGTFDSTMERKTVIGTLKTLRTDLEACGLMGRLGGMLMHCARRYINDEIYRYTPKWELAKERGKDGGNHGE